MKNVPQKNKIMQSELGRQQRNVDLKGKVVFLKIEI
jgi:hypothetical protein